MKTISILYKFSISIFILLFSSNYLFAADYYWTGAISNYYNNTSNWEAGSYSSGTNPSSLPTSSDNLFVGGASSSNYTILLNINDTISNLTIEGSGEVFINSSGGGSTLTIYGNVSNVNANDVGGGTALLAFRGSNSQTLGGNSSSTGYGKFCNITINKSGGSVTLSDFITMGGSTTLSLPSTNAATIYDSNSTLCFSYNNNVRGNWTFHDVEFVGRGLVFTIYDDIVIDGSLFLTGRGGPVEIDSSTIELHGDLENSNSDSRTNINSILLLSNGNDQTFNGSYDLILKTLQVVKSIGKFELTNNIVVTNNLTLTSGIIFTKSSYIISLSDNATVTGGNDTSYIDGPFSKTGNDAFSFKIGKDGKFNPLSISAPSSTSDVLVAEYFTEPSGVTAFNPSLTYIDPCEYWNLDHTTGSSNVYVTLGWDTPCFHIARLNYIKIARDSSSKWVNAGGSTSGNTKKGSITTSSSRSSWGNITLGKTNLQVITNAGRDTGLCTGHSVIIGGAPTASSGMGAKTYSWSPSIGLNSITTANPVATPTLNTTYIVTATDTISEYTKDTIIVNGNPVAHAGIDNAICRGSTIALGGNPTASEGSSPITYAWTPSAGIDTVTKANPLATIDTAISYKLTVTDDYGCIAKDTVSFTVNDLPIISGTYNDVTRCYYNNNGSIDITVTDGAPPYNYVWNNGSRTEDICHLYSGSYNVAVIDTNGCFRDSTFEINAPDTIFLSADVTDESCFGHSDGSIALTITGGTGSFTETYDWGDDNVDSLEAGIYSITVSDAYGCTASLNEIEVKETSVIALIDTVVSVTCELSDGEIKLGASGGDAPYNYSWSSSETTRNIAGLEEGVYVITVTDDNGCKAILTQQMDCIELRRESDSTNQISNGDVIVYPNPTEKNVTVLYNIPEEGRLQISDLTGKIIQTIKLDQTKQSISLNLYNLSSGIYLFRVTSGIKVIKITKVSFTNELPNQ